MAHSILAATNAVVTLDVGIPGIVWPWLVTVNMWAKSIGTGLIFMIFILLKMYPKEIGSLRLPTAIASFIFINIFLLFTLADLHQPFRMWHIFVYSHWTSAIAVGAVMATVFVGLLAILALLALQKKTDAYDRLLLWTAILAIPVTLYTAALMAECTARELWQMPPEAAQMVLAATLSGSAAMILLGGNKLSDNAMSSLGVVLGLSALMSFIIYMSEYVFGAMKAEEIAATLAFIKGNGEWSTTFWVGQWLTFILPMLFVIMSRVSGSRSILKLAAILAIVGLVVVKHVWLVIPQLVPMS